MKDVIKRARLIYNPTSGQEIIKRNIAEVLDLTVDEALESSRRFRQLRENCGPSQMSDLVISS